MKTVSFLRIWVILLFTCYQSFATNPTDDIGSVSGTVLDQTSQPVAYAAIVIKSKDGQTTITGGITLDDGTFEIEKLAEGEYILEVQFIGYETYTQPLIVSKKTKK